MSENNKNKWPPIEHNYDLPFAMANFNKLTIDQCTEVLSEGYSDNDYYQGLAMRHIERVLIILRAHEITSKSASKGYELESIWMFKQLDYLCNNTHVLHRLIEGIGDRIAADPSIAKHLYLPTYIEFIEDRFKEYPLEAPPEGEYLECLSLAIKSFNEDNIFKPGWDDEMHEWVMTEVNNMLSDFTRAAGV